MADVTVRELARSVGAPVDRLLKQMQEAGLNQKSPDARVSDDEKQRFLTFLKTSHAESLAEPKKVTLQRKTTSTIKTGSGSARKTVNVEVRKKKIYVKREGGKADSIASSTDSEINDENILNAIQLGIALTDPLVPGAPFAGSARNYDDGDAIISIFGLNVPIKIENGKFSNIWPDIEDGKPYPELGATHEITLFQSDKVSRVVRSIEPPVGFAAIFLENPVIDDATYPTAKFIVTPISGDQVLYVDSECTIFADGKMSCKDPITTRVFHRVGETGLCYEYNLTIRDAAVEKIKLESIHHSDTETLETDPNETVRPTQINYTPNPRQLPESTSDEDHLNRQPLISALASILAHEANCEHQTIGLLGDWGIGKSTWLELLKKELLTEHKEQVYLFGEFNAWAYEHTDNLQAGIAQEMIKALTSLADKIPKPRHSSPKNYDDRLKQFVDKSGEVFLYPFKWLGRQLHALILRAWLTFCFAISCQPIQLLKIFVTLLLLLIPFQNIFPNSLSNFFLQSSSSNAGSSGGFEIVFSKMLWVGGFGFYFVRQLASIMANPMAKELLTYLKLPNYASHLGTIPMMRENLQAMCRIRLGRLCGKTKRMIFVVDDLDRCGHDGIVKVFEAVRLVLDIKNVTVIIAVDQHIALAALALHYEKVAKHHKLKNPHAIARDYLAKVIHLPIILANPIRADVERYLQRLWHASTSKEDHEMVVREQRDYEQQLGEDQQKIESEKKKVVSNSTGNSEMQSVNDSDVGATASADFVGNGILSPEDSTLSHINPENVGHSEVASLSAAQRRAFIFWLDYFGLTNPRQVKRLNNTYNLLLNCYIDVDKLPVATELPDPMPKALFPMMIALITMEYLNSMNEHVLRNHLRSRLFLRSVGEEDATPSAAPLINEFISAFHLLQDSRDGLVEKVRPFVLPAIEKC